MNAVNAAAIFTTFLLLYTFASAAGVQPVTLHLSRVAGFEPLTTNVEIRIPRNAENREACVTLSGDTYPLACWDLDVNSSPVFTRVWKNLPAGGYRAQAAIRRSGGWLHSNVVLLRVAGEEL